jgi:prepilin-type N-terminal cleavage/methylation domain-containing protein
MRTPDDRGVTLVELIVTIVIAGLFTGLLTVMFIDGWTAQQKTAARDLATGTTNAVGRLMTTSIRNATSITVNSAGMRMDARVVRGDGVVECRAWALDGEFLAYGHSATGPVAAGALKPIQSGAKGGLTGARAFAARSAGSVKVALTFTKGDSRYGETVDVRTILTAQAQAAGSPAAC